MDARATPPGPALTVGADSCDDLLRRLRRARGFDPEQVRAAKVGCINRWFTAEGLDAAVVGLSGGIDSAVTLGLLVAAARDPRSPLRRCVALLLPIDGMGATGQSPATRRARAVADRLDAEAWECPLADAHAATLAALAKGSGLAFDGWSAGQLLSVERTPALYGAAALLQAGGLHSVVVGTTNRDEGAYLGFFGKASDGMVDLQVLSDLHKSEVVALARLLDLPAETIEAAPSGDVWDARTDAEMIGATYDDVELVLRLRELGRDPTAIAAGLHDGDRLRAAADAVERLHRHNRHKYAVGSPVVHLDVLPRGIPGGWVDAPSGRSEHRPTNVPGAWEPPPLTLDGASGLPTVEETPVATLARHVLAPSDCEALAAALEGAPTEPVGVTGVRDDSGVGSMRATAFAPALAAQLWHRLAPAVASVRFLDERSPTDGHATADRAGHRTWRVVGLSPLLRFMRYDPGGRHLCHYDAAFDYGDGRRTLASVVFYLTGDGDRQAGGATRFVADGQDHLPTSDRDHADWTRDTEDHEVVLAVVPEQGAAIVFDHRRGHDVQCWNGPGPRVIIRADVVYEAVPDGRALA